MERQLQPDLNKIEDRADNNGFEFSQSKISLCPFFLRRDFHLYPYLVLYNNPITVKKETKFFGRLLDSKLIFAHSLISKASRKSVSKL